MKLPFLLDALRLSCPPGTEELTVTGISSDSRRTEKGNLFVALSGTHTDGHQFLSDAAARGAVFFLTDKSHPEAAAFLRREGLPFLTAENTREAEAYLQYRFCLRKTKPPRIIAVTGTNGKTTCVSLLSHIYRTAGCRVAAVGTLTGDMTTPDPPVLYPLLADAGRAGTDFLFMEASSHALALCKLAPLSFAQGIFTNLTPEHLDFHSDMASYRDAKAKLFRQCTVGILNGDSPAAGFMTGAAVSYSCTAEKVHGDFIAENITLSGIRGVSYYLRQRDKLLRIHAPLPGSFSVMNTLEAAASALLTGIPDHVIRSGIRSFPGVPGRLERVILPTDAFSVYLDFAHTPDALENILKTLRSFLSPGQRIILVFGCGGERDRSKRPVMGKIASLYADYTVLTSDNCRGEDPLAILTDILPGMTGDAPYTVIADRTDAIFHAVYAARPGDTVLLCGKGHEQYEIDARGKHPFSEKETALAAVKQRLAELGE